MLLLLSGGVRKPHKQKFCERTASIVSVLEKKRGSTVRFSKLDLSKSMKVGDHPDKYLDRERCARDDSCFVSVKRHPAFWPAIIRAETLCTKVDILLVICRSGRHRSVGVIRQLEIDFEGSIVGADLESSSWDTIALISRFLEGLP